MHPACDLSLPDWRSDMEHAGHGAPHRVLHHRTGAQLSLPNIRGGLCRYDAPDGSIHRMVLHIEPTASIPDILRTMRAATEPQHDFQAAYNQVFLDLLDLHAIGDISYDRDGPTRPAILERQALRHWHRGPQPEALMDSWVARVPAWSAIMGRVQHIHVPIVIDDLFGLGLGTSWSNQESVSWIMPVSGHARLHARNDILKTS